MRMAGSELPAVLQPVADTPATKPPYCPAMIFGVIKPM